MSRGGHSAVSGGGPPPSKRRRSDCIHRGEETLQPDDSEVAVSEASPLETICSLESSLPLIPVDIEKCRFLFHRYACADSGFIDVNGLRSLAEDVEADPDGLWIRCFQYFCAPSAFSTVPRERLWEIHWDGWMKGIQRIGCDSIETLRENSRMLPFNVRLLAFSEELRKICEFVFDIFAHGGSRLTRKHLGEKTAQMATTLSLSFVIHVLL